MSEAVDTPSRVDDCEPTIVDSREVDPNAAYRSSDVRACGRCPLCAAFAVIVDRLHFAPKPPLRNDIAFHFCERCNFLFAGDLSERAYRRYYETVRNDGDHVILSEDLASYDRLQGLNIAAAVSTDFSGSVLDIGCGQGRLLQYLAKHFPAASLAGYDVANYLPRDAAIRFLDSIDGLDRHFDVIVLSHVVEHLVEFDLLARVSRLLEPGGLLYLEVPNPFAYVACSRREFMYYFDRLHVNHFGPRAIGKLLARFNLRIVEQGTHRFRYRDGYYPAAFFFATHSAEGERSPNSAQSVEDEPALHAVYRAYRASEAVRAREWQQRLPPSVRTEGLLVYGGGDNFHRALWSDGPLHGLPILTVMDQRAVELQGASGHRYAPPEVALARYPSAPVVVTVSQGSEEIAKAVRQWSPGRAIFFI